MEESRKRGMLIVYTGNGKGKTTAALGLAVRAAGHKKRVIILQFLKSDWGYGEIRAVERLSPEVEIRPLGVGCVGILGDKKPIEEHREAARKALAVAEEIIDSKKYEMVILDEISIAVSLKLIEADDVMRLIRRCSPEITLVITGRDADERVIEAADLVTEMKEVKHPYRKGIKAQKGIDY